MIDLKLWLSLQKTSCSSGIILNATSEELEESIELGMMSANEFFDCGPEPPWLVDACGGEVVSPNSELEFSYQAPSSSSAPYLELNHGTEEAGPSNSDMHMDLDEEESRPNDAAPFAYNHHHQQEFQLVRQSVTSGIHSVRPATPLSLEQHRTWLSPVTPNAPIRAPTRMLAPAPAADNIFRACKKRKRSYA